MIKHIIEIPYHQGRECYFRFVENDDHNESSEKIADALLLFLNSCVSTNVTKILVSKLEPEFGKPIEAEVSKAFVNVTGKQSKTYPLTD